jgi:hypothetical protein
MWGVEIRRRDGGDKSLLVVAKERDRERDTDVVGEGGCGEEL